jgi:alcohol dehydrogenase
MTKTMKAAMYRSFGGPIRVETVPRPTAPLDGVVIEVQATGVCRSDWHGWKGHDGDVIAHGLPFCPGHEVSGVVVEVGSHVQRFSLGDRVAVPFILSCGSCRQCHQHRPTVCLQQEQPGFTQWGSFAEYCVLPRADRNLHPMPDAVSFVQAAALGCRFTTAYRAAIQQGKLVPNQSIAILGVGGLGLSCVMIAHTVKAFPIIAVDISARALQKAKTLGATHTIQIQPNDAPESICAKLQVILKDDGGADVSIDAAGFPLTSAMAVYATRPAGRMVQVGLPTEAPIIPMGLVAGKELELVGSHGFAADDLPDLLQWVATGRLDPSLLVEREVTLEEGCQALQDMDHSSPLGMVMITKFVSEESSRL